MPEADRAAVRVATTADIERAAETLALAHEQYEWAVWAFPGPDRADVLRQLYRLDLELAVSVRSAWVDEHVSSVAIWSPPKPVQIDAALAAASERQQDQLIGDGATATGGSRRVDPRAPADCAVLVPRHGGHATRQPRPRAGHRGHRSGARTCAIETAPSRVSRPRAKRTFACTDDSASSRSSGPRPTTAPCPSSSCTASRVDRSRAERL